MESNQSRIAVCNQKGGIGKSTFTTLLASHLHYSLGCVWLVVDCDYPQWSIQAQRERELAAVEQSDYYKLMLVWQFRQTGRKLWPVVRCMPADAGTEVGRFLYGNLNLNKLFEGRQIRAIFATDFHFVPGLYIKNIVR